MGIYFETFVDGLGTLVSSKCFLAGLSFVLRRFPAPLVTTGMYILESAFRLLEVCMEGSPSGEVLEGESERGRTQAILAEGPLTFWSHFAQHWSSKSSAQTNVEKVMPTCSPKGS